MEFIRFMLRDLVDPPKITIDIPCERNDQGTLISIKHLTYYGEWVDGDGDRYILAVRGDDTVDYGYYGNEGTKRATFALHGRTMSPNVVYEYRDADPTQNGDFEIDAIYQGGKWARY